MKQLNLGCGQFPQKGFINADISMDTPADIFFDLSKIPYPFKDNSFELVIAEHVIEHLENPFDVMKEICRILIPGGRIIIKVPHFSRGFTHPDHKRGFDVSFYYYFYPECKAGYTGLDLISKGVKMKWFAQEHLKKIVLSENLYIICKTIGNILDFLANLCPFFCSRIWAFWVGGFEEVEFQFIKPESDEKNE